MTALMAKSFINILIDAMHLARSGKPCLVTAPAIRRSSVFGSDKNALISYRVSGA